MKRKPQAEAGFSMLEMMVSMALGLVVLLAATQLFVTNQVTLNFQRGAGDVQTGGRFALDMVLRDLRVAGLPAPGESAVAGVVLDVAEMPGLTGTALVSRDGASAGGISSSDQLMIQYAALDPTEDCEGTAVPRDSYVIARYFLRNDAATGSVALVCDGGQRTGSTIAGLSASPSAGAVLVSGVDSFQVLLGLDDGANNTAFPTRYVNIATYNALAVKPRVVSMRVGILVRSQERVGDAVAPAGDVVVLDSTIQYNDTTRTAALVDGRLRRLFVSTVGLRNIDPASI